jgi:uncharacterized protein (TIGR02594 family)
MIPDKYKWLLNEGAPAMLVEALKHYGTLEHKGSDNNASIVKWAKELGKPVEDVYKADSIPWCGLFMGIVAKRCGYDVPKSPLWALSWATFGQRAECGKLGYVMVFVRNGGGHVALYVGEDAASYYVLGGNQSDAVNITRIAKSRLYTVRKPIYKIKEPDNVRSIILTTGGIMSTNEK